MAEARPGRVRRAVARSVVPVLTAAAVVAAAAAGWHNSATNDEPYHILAAWTYVVEGHGDLNPEHPPLVKLVTGAALAPLGLRGPQAPPVDRLLQLADEVRRFLYDNTRPAEEILLVARLAQLPFLVLLLVGTWLLGRDLGGVVAGRLAVVAVATQPLVLGHAFVVHTDVPAAAAWVWTLLLLRRWLAGARAGWVATGVALGLGLLVKFSSVYLAAVVVLAVLLHLLRQRSRAVALGLAGVLAVAGAVVIAGYQPVLRNVSTAEERAVIAAYTSLWPDAAPLAEVLDATAAVSRAAAQWGLGLSYVWETNRRGQGINVFLGQVRTTGFAAYFPTALAVKTTLPFLVLAVAGIAAAVRRRVPGIGVPLLAAGVYLLASIGSSYNIGARHLIPMLPLLAAAAATGAVGWPRWARASMAAALLLPPVVAFPHYIAHFSAAVGGPERGARILNDSNLDWGQDWNRLAAAARRAGWHPMTVVYLGSGDPVHALPGASDFLDTLVVPDHGWVAVSRWMEAAGVPYLRAYREDRAAARLAELLARIREHGRRVAVIGHSIDVYRIGPAPTDR